MKPPHRFLWCAASLALLPTLSAKLVASEGTLREATAAAPVAGSIAVQPGPFRTAEELDRFVTGYYQHPRPESITAVIEVLGATGFAGDDRARVFTGFFAEVFAANPDRLADWRKLIDREQDKPARDCLREALKLSRPGAVLAARGHSVENNDRLWGAFFATGNPAYLGKLIDSLPLIDNERWADQFWAGATAVWSLARNAPEHPLVRTTLASAQATAAPRTRAIIDDLLAKDPSAIRDDLDTLYRTRKFPASVGTLGGMSSASIGASAGLPPPKP